MGTAHVGRLLKTDLFEEAFGQDSLVDALVRAYPSVIGMDISQTVVAAARAREPRAGYIASDAYDLPFRSQIFDLIVSIPTLDHLPRALFPMALADLCRVLSPGVGTLPTRFFTGRYIALRIVKETAGPRSER